MLRRKEPDGLDDAERQCKPLACEIQTCLKRKQYNQEACSAFIDRYNECVRKAREQNAGATVLNGDEEEDSKEET